MNRAHLLLLALATTLTACEGEIGPAGADGMDGENGVDGVDGDDGAPGVDGDDGADGDDGLAGSDGEDGADGDDGLDGEDGEDGLNGGEFGFRTELPEDYERVDRMGMPAITTAVIAEGNKNAYNQATLQDDVDGDFVPDITASIDLYHSCLDDELMALGLVPCETQDCVGQAAPFVVPDVQLIDTMAPAGFPNGRLPSDTAVDVTLGLILLDLTAQTDGGEDQTPFLFVDIGGLSQDMNDAPYLASFPYIASPNF